MTGHCKQPYRFPAHYLTLYLLLSAVLMLFYFVVIIVNLSDLVQTWPLGFSLAPGAARLQASAVSKNVGGLPSWSVQLDSPATALTMDEWIRPVGVKQSG